MGTGQDLMTSLYQILEGVAADKGLKYCPEAITRQKWKTW